MTDEQQAGGQDVDAAAEPDAPEDADSTVTAEDILKRHGVSETAAGFGPQLLAKVPELEDHHAYKVPDGYEINQHGVWLIQNTKEGPKSIRVAWGPLLISRMFTDPDGEQLVELAWRDRNRTVAGLVPRAATRSGKKLIAALGNSGFPVVEADAKLVERWLAALDATNWTVIPEFSLARWLGWQPDGTFLCSTDEGHTVHPVYAEQQGAVDAHQPRGTLDGWKKAMLIIRDLPHPRVLVAASFASPLLEVFGLDSFGLDSSAPSSGGKSTAARGSMSVWASPSPYADAVINWRTGLISIEKRLNATRGLPTVIDETMALKYEKLIDDVLYQLPANRGTARGGDYPSMLPWQTILISTGERSILTYTKNQGAAARVLELHGVPFGEGGGPAAVEFQAATIENYGVAGPAFMAWLRPHLADGGWMERARHRFSALRGEFLGESAISARRAPMVALLALAEEWACRAEILPYEPLPVQRWRELLVQDAETDNRPEMALDVVREYLASHPNEFYGVSSDQAVTPMRGWAGELKKERGDGGREFVAFLSGQLEDALDAKGYSLDAVAEQWADAGHLRLGKNQRPRWKANVRIAGAPGAKCVSFWRDALDGEPEGGDAPRQAREEPLTLM